MAAGGHMDEFGEFYATRRDAVYRAVLVATRHRAGTEDAVAEAFTRAYSRWDTVGRHPNPTAWVVRTALNTQRTWWRRLARQVPVAERDLTPAPPDRPGGLPGELRAMVAALPRRQREVVALRVLADLSAAETGALLGIAPATVHVHLHRALATLRAGLDPDPGPARRPGAGRAPRALDPAEEEAR